jgi:hypothetical protein
MPAYHGKKSVIYLSTGGAAQAAYVPFIAEWTLDKSVDTVEVTSFGDTNKVFVQGLPNLAGTFSGFFDSAQDVIFDASESATPVKMYIYPSTDVPSNYHFGTAWISASMASGIAAAVTMTGSFVGAGSWGRNP